MNELMKTGVPDFSNWSCPLPLVGYPTIVMGHGGGGKLGNELVEHLFLPVFRNPALENLGDAALLDVTAGKIGDEHRFVCCSAAVFSWWKNIGGARCQWDGERSGRMSGATPKFLSASFILEEGFPLAQLAAIVESMAKAAAIAGVKIVTGDTEGCGSAVTAMAATLNTAGIGVVREGIQVGPHRAQVGDAVLVSGTIGDHGMAIMSVREGLEFESQIRSDCAALNGMISDVLNVARGAVHTMRDPTRGGLASTLNEIAQSSQVGVVIDEASLPVRTEVASACELLGLDPVYVANEGKAVFFVDEEVAETVLALLRAHPLGRAAARIGHVTSQHKGMLVARTAMGSNRVIPTQIGEQLPRIC